MIHQLYSVAWATGLSVKENLDAIQPFAPDGKCNLLKALHLFFDYSVARVDDAVAIAQAQFHGLISRVQLYDQLGGEFFPRQALRPTGLREVLRVLERRGPLDPNAAVTADPGAGGATETGCLHVVLPFYLGKSLRRARETCMPAGFLKRIEADLAASTIFGTGNTLSSGTFRVAAEYLPVEDPKVNPRLVWQRHVLATFDQEYIPLALGPDDVRLAYLGVVDDGGALAQTMSATDFTHAEVRGKSVRTLREPVDNFVRIWNATGLDEGDAHDGILPAATAANVETRQIPLVAPPARATLSQLPLERSPIVTLSTGAGSPAVTDQAVYAVTIAPTPADWFAGNWSLMTRGANRASDIAKNIGAPEGTNGKTVSAMSVSAIAPRPVAWRTVLGK